MSRAAGAERLWFRFGSMLRGNAHVCCAEYETLCVPQVVSLDSRSYKDCIQKGTWYHQHHAQDSMPHVTLLGRIIRMSHADIDQTPVAWRLGAPVAGNLEGMYHSDSLKPLPNP